MKALITVFGYEGYGRFWALNEKIAETSGAFIDISRKVYKLALANELGFNGDELDNFLTFLSDPDIDLINIRDNKITTDRISEIFTQTMESRKKERNKKTKKRKNADFPGENDTIPPENADFPGENDTDNTIQDNTKLNKTIPNTAGSDEPPDDDEKIKSQEAIDLARLLLATHRAEKKYSDFLAGKDKNVIPRWAADIEKLIRIDKKAPETIRRVILWVKTPGNFWFHNIESGATLRRQFERLYGLMTQTLGNPAKQDNANSFIPNSDETTKRIEGYEKSRQESGYEGSLTGEFINNLREKNKEAV
jgi:hypothetical protein